MSGKRLVGYATMACTLASYGVFSPNTALIYNSLKKYIHRINITKQLNGRVVMKGYDLSLPFT